MIRPLAALALIAAVASPALSSPAFAQSRDKLPAVNGVGFGDGLDKARGVLGPKFEESTAPDDKMTNILAGSAPLFGKTFRITYAFGDGDRVNGIEAVAELGTDDVAACKGHWTQVRDSMAAALGKPDAADDKTAGAPPTASATFDYRDGGEVHAVMLGCLIQVTWTGRPSAD